MFPGPESWQCDDCGDSQETTVWTKTKPRFQEKLKTKKCRDTQYRHNNVTIVTHPVGLSARLLCDLPVSDWSSGQFLGLWLATGGVTLLMRLVTVFQVISHSVTALVTNVMGTLSFMRSAAWHFSCCHQCLTESETLNKDCPGSTNPISGWVHIILM